MNPTAQPRGFILGALGILGFSLTSPMLRIAAAQFGPAAATFGQRAAIRRFAAVNEA